MPDQHGQKDYQRASEWYQKASGKGHLISRYRLARMLHQGKEGIPQDIAAAASFYRLAAEQGHMRSQFYLGFLFLKGNACQHNTIFNLERNHECMLSNGAKCAYSAMLLFFVSASLLIVNEEGGVEEGRAEDAGEEDGAGGEDHDERREPLCWNPSWGVPAQHNLQSREES